MIDFEVERGAQVVNFSRLIPIILIIIKYSIILNNHVPENHLG